MCVAGTAHADITGTISNSAGFPVSGARVNVTDAVGRSASFQITDANGAYRVPTTSLSGDTPPFTVAATLSDRCRPFAESELTATAGGVVDGAAQNFTLDALTLCSTFTPSGAPDPTGNAWPEKGQVLAGPGGVVYLRVLAPSSATAFTLTLADGTVVGSGPSSSELTLTAPPSAYSGPLGVNYTSDGLPFSRVVGTLTSGPVPKPARRAGISDLAAIVDVSGSMSGNDPTNRRREAVNLLVDLAGQGDRLAGIGFDGDLREIFPRTTVVGNSTKSRLKAKARKKIGNFGGTDYNVGLAGAFTALSADPLNPAVPKSAIFLTDGAHGGTYDNSHLRFAFNGTGKAWPICVVQLGRNFQRSDTTRLKRIARETGGTFAKAPNNAQLENLYFQCRGKSSGATTLLRKRATFRIGQTRNYSRKVAKRQRAATFFVSWGVGKYRVQLIRPGGKVYKRSVGKRVRFVRGKSSSFFQVQKPKAGRWRIRVTRLKTGSRTDIATTTVTVQKRR